MGLDSEITKVLYGSNTLSFSTSTRVWAPGKQTKHRPSCGLPAWRPCKDRSQPRLHYFGLMSSSRGPCQPPRFLIFPSWSL